MILNFDEMPVLHKKVFLKLYKEYRKQNYYLRFNNSDEIINTLFPNISSEEMCRICWNLKRNGFLNCYAADNLPCGITLTNDSLAFMEHRSKNKLKSVINFLISLK